MVYGPHMQASCHTESLGFCLAWCVLVQALGQPSGGPAPGLAPPDMRVTVTADPMTGMSWCISRDALPAASNAAPC